MLDLQLITDPTHKMLKMVSSKVLNFQGEGDNLVADMTAIMREKSGLGLAAIQVGVPVRLFIMNTRMEGVLAIYNPEILEQEKKAKAREGCLSAPGKTVSKARYKRIKVKYQDCCGKVVERKFTGIEARIFQHELDHLNGITIFD